MNRECNGQEGGQLYTWRQMREGMDYIANKFEQLGGCQSEQVYQGWGGGPMWTVTDQWHHRHWSYGDIPMVTRGQTNRMTNWMTDPTENIIFPQLRWQTVTIGHVTDILAVKRRSSSRRMTVNERTHCITHQSSDKIEVPLQSLAQRSVRLCSCCHPCAVTSYVKLP